MNNNKSYKILRKNNPYKNEMGCVNCGEVDQEPMYESICGFCGHIQ